MPKNYILKTNYISQETLNRLVKKIVDNTTSDRIEVMDLLKSAKEKLAELDNSTDEVANLQYIDMFKATIPLLKEVQNVSSTLLKAMSLIDSHTKTLSNGKSGKTSSPQDLFSKLSELSLSDDD